MHVSDDDLVTVTTFATRAELSAAVESLTLAGIGAVGERADQDAAGTFRVAVLVTDAERACDVLGVEPSQDLMRRVAELGAKARPRWVWVLAIFAVAMIVLPALAFYVTYKLTGG